MLLVPPVLGALQKVIFSLQNIDDRKLIITPEYVHVGTDKYEWGDIETVAIYLGGYYGLKYGLKNIRSRRAGSGVPGDDNVLAFRYKGKHKAFSFST
ncbi:hypothetical protein [Paraflavitalea speifideaquila]|uniref:hypothetical protein n=1 Tax=Paraflavitalea speifideaquila TaxID=3076558 RepID=UPI0028E354F5|nr:hypothetical protein [Paraflavitalea speifideiaquila]